MEMVVNRQQFLTSLEWGLPGLYKKDEVEQGKCFAFHGGNVHSFNEEIACCGPTGLDKKFQGAISADTLVNVLRRLPDEDLRVDFSGEELILIGKNRASHHLVEKELALSPDMVEKPDTWKKINPDFLEAIGIVQECASLNPQHHFDTTCVHIYPKWVEACDGVQVCRWNLKTNVTKSTLVKRAAIKHIVQAGISEFSETENWLHFRNPSGLVISLRRYVEEYRDLTSYLKVDGEKAVLPKGLADEILTAEIWSSQDKDNNKIVVELSSGKVRIKSVGVGGRFKAWRKAKYNGEPRSFRIAPKLLAEVVKRHSEIEVASNKLKAQVEGKFVYVVALGKVESNGSGKVKNKVNVEEEV